MCPTKVFFLAGAFLILRIMLIERIDLSKTQNPHRVLGELVKQIRVIYKRDWSKDMDYMTCTKFKIFYDSFESINADSDLLNNPYNRYDGTHDDDSLEDIMSKTFHIIKMFNPENYIDIFKYYANHINEFTIYTLNLEYVNEMMKVLDAANMSSEEVRADYSIFRNWERLGTAGDTDVFLKELNLDKKLFKNRKYLSKALEMIKDNKIVTVSSLGIKGKLSYWKNITGLVNELNTCTDISGRKDAIYTIEECFRYFDMLKYKPSIREAKRQIGGSDKIIKIAMEYYYNKEGKIYNEDSEAVIERINEQIKNPLQYKSVQDGVGISLEFNRE
tara:strand:+ start:501 stop:1493 length:993 start_codon:yes stop_codon:yes gene_type:complete